MPAEINMDETSYFAYTVVF